MRFQGKIAVVTGGNRGIGRAAAERLAREGATVLIVGRDRVDNAAAAQALNLERPGTAEAFAVDVTDAAAIAEFAAAVRASYGHVDILVNNAGICHLTTAFTELTDAAWQETLAVNLFGVLRFTRALLPLLLAAGGGKFVMIASLAAEVGGIATAADYVASKAALLGLTKSLARELGPQNINVNAVAPGFVRTPMTRAMQIRLDSIPLRRIAEPEDIANAVAFLASEEARCITGTTLDVNGGLYMK